MNREPEQPIDPPEPRIPSADDTLTCESCGDIADSMAECWNILHGEAYCDDCYSNMPTCLNCEEKTVDEDFCSEECLDEYKGCL